MLMLNSSICLSCCRGPVAGPLRNHLQGDSRAGGERDKRPPRSLPVAVGNRILLCHPAEQPQGLGPSLVAELPPHPHRSCHPLLW